MSQDLDSALPLSSNSSSNRPKRQLSRYTVGIEAIGDALTTLISTGHSFGRLEIGSRLQIKYTYIRWHM